VPWCIIGWLKFQQVMAHFEGRLDFRVQWHPFELNPDMPAEGEDAAEHVMRKYGISAEQSRANSGKMAGVAPNSVSPLTADRVSGCATASMRTAC
jgi:predicted DsbA family dithiol-disulfide isomerase